MQVHEEDGIFYTGITHRIALADLVNEHFYL